MNGLKKLSLPTLLILATLACNIPAGIPPTPAPDYAATITAQAILLAQRTPSASQPDVPTPAATAVQVQPSSLPPTTVPAPTEGVIQSDLPKVTLPGGNGYIFSSQLTSKDDRDIWWNGVQFVPDRTVRMVSLGMIDNPVSVAALSFSGQSPNVLTPVIGEGFGLEIDRDGQMQYAVIRVMQIDAQAAVTFDWVYPFNGSVSSNQ